VQLPRGHRAGNTAVTLLAGLLVMLAMGCAPLPVATNPAASAPTDADADQAIAFRLKSGLRADLDWVLQLAGDPAAQAGRREFGIPLSPAELTALRARVSTARDVANAAEAYGRGHPDEYAGTFTDPPRGVVVAMFTADLSRHEHELWALVHPDAPLEVRLAAHTLAALEELQLQVRADAGELRAMGIDILANGVRPSANAVEVEVTTNRADVRELFASRYGTGWVVLHVTAAHPSLAPGEIRGRAVDASGKGVEGLDVRPTDPNRDFGGVGISTAPNGSFVVRNAFAGTYSISVFRLVGEAWTDAGSAIVTVEPGRTATVLIPVTGP
jgi:hypothetical protein